MVHIQIANIQSQKYIDTLSSLVNAFTKINQFIAGPKIYQFANDINHKINEPVKWQCYVF